MNSKTTDGCPELRAPLPLRLPVRGLSSPPASSAPLVSLPQQAYLLPPTGLSSPHGTAHSPRSCLVKTCLHTRKLRPPEEQRHRLRRLLCCPSHPGWRLPRVPSP